MTRIVIIGGGPAGYEAALVAAQLGAEVTVIERDGIGGACVLYDCVPSKTFIASAGADDLLPRLAALGLRGTDLATGEVSTWPAVNQRVKGLAVWQSADIWPGCQAEGVRMLAGRGRFAAESRGRPRRVEVVDADGQVTEELDADVVLLATGATPRVLPGAVPDGERILSWRQVYDLTSCPSTWSWSAPASPAPSSPAAYLEWACG